jgi:hypothetical protein
MFKALHLSILIVLAVFTAGCGGLTGQNITVNAVEPKATPTLLTSPAAASPSASPTMLPTPDGSTEESSGDQEIAAVIRQYYEAINRHEYQRAFDLWSGKGEASKQTFDDFRNGFAETAHVNAVIDEKHIEVEGAAGSQYATVPVTISAKMSGGRQQNYHGKYVLRRSMVDGATAEQRSWRIYSAEIERVP